MHTGASASTSAAIPTSQCPRRRPRRSRPPRRRRTTLGRASTTSDRLSRRGNGPDVCQHGGVNWSNFTRRARCGVIVAVFAMAAACNAHQQAIPNTNEPLASQNRLGNSSSYDAWTTFGYDDNRTGYNPNVTNLTKSNVSQLQLRWTVNLGDAVFASPVEYAGNLIVVTEGTWGGNPDSVVYDLSTYDGHVIWKYTLGRRDKMTPAIDPDAGLVILGRQSRQSYIYALRLLDGTLVWRTKIKGRPGGAPLVAGGMVYTGRAGGDPPGC